MGDWGVRRELKLYLGQRREWVTRGQQGQGASKQEIVSGDRSVGGRMHRSRLHLEMRKLKVRSESSASLRPGDLDLESGKSNRQGLRDTWVNPSVITTCDAEANLSHGRPSPWSVSPQGRQSVAWGS